MKVLHNKVREEFGFNSDVVRGRVRLSARIQWGKVISMVMVEFQNTGRALRDITHVKRKFGPDFTGVQDGEWADYDGMGDVSIP
ncbi:Fanconi Anemia Group F Protein, partial [Manis pentadactyla]